MARAWIHLLRVIRHTNQRQDNTARPYGAAMNYFERLTEQAIRRLQRGLPLRVDQTARLLEAGVDVVALERRYAL